MRCAEARVRRAAERTRRAGAAHSYVGTAARITNGAINAAASSRRSPSLCDLPARGDATRSARRRQGIAEGTTFELRLEHVEREVRWHELCTLSRHSRDLYSLP